ncbi:hypothetical protein FOFC_09771 [Fusarium oxysporum]|nr:hypothetical protein FOFC_09771 [Fusarium oxysporum]
MLWRRSRLTYDPKQFPNYRPYPETGSERLIKECPNVFHFIAFTIRFQISIFSIILEWFCMMLRSPLQYSKHTDWILDHYKASPTASHMLWGAFITAWSSHFMYRIGKAVCEVIIDAYDDPVWALYEIWDLGVYSQFFLIRTIFFILTTIFNFVCFWAIFLFNMSTYSFVVSLALLGAVAMWQLHYYFFVYSPQEVTEEVADFEHLHLLLGRPLLPPDHRLSILHLTFDPDHQTNPLALHTSKYLPKPYKSYMTKESSSQNPPEYPTTLIWNPSLENALPTSAAMMQRGTSEDPDPYKDDPPSPTVITKTAWIYSEMDAVNRRLRSITEDVTEMNMLVNTFREKGSVRSLPDASPAIPLSPRTQRRNATLAEKDRIGEVVIDYTREIDSISFRVFSHKTRTEEALKRIDRLVAHAGDAASRAIRKEVEACRSRVDLAFEGAEAAVMSSSGIADLCIDRKVKLEAQAKKLRRMDRTQARHPNISIIDDYYG